MSPKEVIDSLLRRGKAERVGVNDSPWPDTLTRWVEQGYPVDDENNPVDPVDHFGFDLCAVGGFFDVMPLCGVMEVVEETDECVLKRNGAGAVLRWWKNKSGTPEHIDFRMTSRAVWEKDYRRHLLEVDRDRLNQEVVDVAGMDFQGMDIESSRKALAKRREQGRWAFFGHWFIWSNMQMSMGDLCMCESLLTDPEWIHDYNRVYTDFYKAHFGLLVEEVGRPDGFWIYDDLGYKNGLFCSPKLLEELFLPYYKELVDFLHSYDAPVVLHSCGGITEALPIIVAAGFDGLNPMEVKAGCDTLRFAEEYGDQLTFFGGLDARVLESGDRDVIRREVVRLVEGMKERGARYVFGSDHSLSTNIGYQDFLCALDVYREHMAY